VKQYLDLLRYVYEHGETLESRAVLQSDGSRPRTRSVFGYQCRYDLRQGFPLVTTKYVPFRQVAAELCWFLSGSTNIAGLHKYNVRIWDEWSDENGDLGPIYGKQWRRWDAEFDGNFGEDPDRYDYDQIEWLIRSIECVVKNPSDSTSRRLLLTSFNPGEADWRTPTACHTLCQLSVRNGRLHSHLYQRSGDLFLGVPWNIACYAALTHLLADRCSLGVGDFIHSFGDAHIYENHLPQVEEQLKREPLPLPTLSIRPGYDPTLKAMSPDDFVLHGYQHHPKLTAEVAV